MIELLLLGGNVLTTIGDRIRRERKRQGYSQKALCKDICSQPTLSRMENNKLDISFLTVNQILGRLNLSVNDLLAQEEDIQENIFFDRLDEAREARQYIVTEKIIASFNRVTEEPSSKVKMYIKWHQSLAAFSREDYDTASSLLNHAIYIAEKFNYTDFIPQLYMAKGNTEHQLGARPLKYYAYAEELCHELEVPNFKLEMKILYNLIVSCSMENQYHQVILKCKKAMKILSVNASAYLMCEIYYLWMKALIALVEMDEYEQLKVSTRIIFDHANRLDMLDKLENYSHMNI